MYCESKLAEEARQRIPHHGPGHLHRLIGLVDIRFVNSSELGARAWDVTEASNDLFLFAALWCELDVMNRAGLGGTHGDGEGEVASGVGCTNSATEPDEVGGVLCDFASCTAAPSGAVEGLGVAGRVTAVTVAFDRSGNIELAGEAHRDLDSRGSPPRGGGVDNAEDADCLLSGRTCGRVSSVYQLDTGREEFAYRRGEIRSLAFTGPQRFSTSLVFCDIYGPDVGYRAIMQTQVVAGPVSALRQI